MTEHSPLASPAPTRRPVRALTVVGIVIIGLLVFALAWFWCAGSYTEEFTGGRRLLESLGLTLLLVTLTSLPGFLAMQALSPGGTMFEPPPYVP